MYQYVFCMCVVYASVCVCVCVCVCVNVFKCDVCCCACVCVECVCKFFLSQHTQLNIYTLPRASSYMYSHTRTSRKERKAFSS